MTYPNLKSTLFAATVALTLLVPAAHAQAAKATAPTVAPTVGTVIAAQGNAALRAIRAEMKAAIKLVKPQAPARATKVSVPGASSAPATAALAE
jgi:hypothetical protein